MLRACLARGSATLRCLGVALGRASGVTAVGTKRILWRSARRGSANDPKAMLSKWQKAIDHGAREIQGSTFSDVQSRPVQPLPTHRICCGVGLSAKPFTSAIDPQRTGRATDSSRHLKVRNRSEDSLNRQSPEFTDAENVPKLNRRQGQTWRKPRTQSHGSSPPPRRPQRHEGPKIAGLPPQVLLRSWRNRPCASF